MVKKEYEKPLLRIVRPLYPNKADEKDEDFISSLNNFKETIYNNATKIFEENKIVYIDFENKSKVLEYWREKDIQNYDKHYETFIYKAISLFIIKIPDPKSNPASIIEYIKDSHNIAPNLNYFPFVYLSSAIPSGERLQGAIISMIILSLNT
jgi:hypothetical protein